MLAIWTTVALHALLIAGDAGCWSSQLQTITALWTTEAEYVPAVDAGNDVVWMRQPLGKLGFTLSVPSVLCMDNQSAISVAKNLEHHGRMKHLGLRFYWSCNVVDSGIIAPVFVPTTADIFTKLLAHAGLECCHCEPSLTGKMHALPFCSTGTVTSGILGLVHGDLVSMPVASASGYRYFVAFHDNASGFHAA